MAKKHRPDNSGMQRELWGTPLPNSDKQTPKRPTRPRKTNKTIGRILWSWPVIGTSAVLLYGIGANATYGHDWIVASVLFFLAILVATLKFITWEETRSVKYKVATMTSAVLFAVIFLAASLYWAYEKRERSSEDRSHLHILTIERSPLVIGNPLFVNIFFVNDGHLMMTARIYYLIEVDKLLPDIEMNAKQEELFNKMLNDIKTGRVAEPPEMEIPPNAPRFMTDTVGMPLVKAYISNDELPKLQSGELVVHYMGRIIYRDSNGEHVTEYCGTITREPYIRISCRRHNTEE